MGPGILGSISNLLYHLEFDMVVCIKSYDRSNINIFQMFDSQSTFFLGFRARRTKVEPDSSHPLFFVHRLL